MLQLLVFVLLIMVNCINSNDRRWSADEYPDPRIDHLACNVADTESTLCDPDRVLTDVWRAQVDANIRQQINKLKKVHILYKNDAMTVCDRDDHVQIFVVLAKFIRTIDDDRTLNNDADLVRFGAQLADQRYRLREQQCRNYLILVGVESAKLAYFKTGDHLRLPSDVTNRVFNQYTSLFNSRNYMDGLNRIIEDIGNVMTDPFRPISTTTTTTTTVDNRLETVDNDTIGGVPVDNNAIAESALVSSIDRTDQSNDIDNRSSIVNRAFAWWIWLLLLIVIVTAAIIIIILIASRRMKRSKTTAVGSLQLESVPPSTKIHPTNAGVDIVRRNNRDDNECIYGVAEDNNHRQQQSSGHDDDRKSISSLESVTVMQESSANTIRPSTPTKVATKVKLDPILLTTDKRRQQVNHNNINEVRL